MRAFFAITGNRAKGNYARDDVLELDLICRDKHAFCCMAISKCESGARHTQGGESRKDARKCHVRFLNE